MKGLSALCSRGAGRIIGRLPHVWPVGADGDTAAHTFRIAAGRRWRARRTRLPSPAQQFLKDSMARLKEIVIDCNIPSRVARFWAEALDGYDVMPYDDEELARLAALGLTPETDPTVMVEGPGTRLCFHLRQGSVRPATGFISILPPRSGQGGRTAFIPRSDLRPRSGWLHGLE